MLARTEEKLLQKALDYYYVLALTLTCPQFLDLLKTLMACTVKMKKKMRIETDTAIEGLNRIKSIFLPFFKDSCRRYRLAKRERQITIEDPACSDGFFLRTI